MKKHKLTQQDETRDRSLWYRALRLKNHMSECAKCSGADKATSYDAMCNEGIALCIRMAEAFAFIERLHHMADPSGQGIYRVCPEPEVHGQSYGMYADWYSVVGVQETIF